MRPILLNALSHSENRMGVDSSAILFLGHDIGKIAGRAGPKSSGLIFPHRCFESFNGKFRDECLNEHWFTCIAQARAVIGAWRQDYNEARPHSALNYLSPAQFAAKHRAASAASAAQELV
jgi:putative transposase